MINVLEKEKELDIILRENKDLACDIVQLLHGVGLQGKRRITLFIEGANERDSSRL